MPNNYNDYSYISCRTLGHAWDEVQDDGGARRLFKASVKTIVRKKFRCVRCKMARYEAWSKVTGDLLFRDYRIPNDYSIKQKVKRNQWRKAYLNG
jgi:hypothetical protein